MQSKHYAVVIVALVALLTPMVVMPTASADASTSNSEIRAVQAFSGDYPIRLMGWEHWSDEEGVQVDIAKSDDIGITSMEGYPPASEFWCYTPLIVQDDDSLAKGYFMGNVKPTKCVWEYYNSKNQLVYTVEKEPEVVEEGSFGDEGYQWAFSDQNTFKVGAFPPTGDWSVRSYFKFENGNTGAEGPAVDDDGNSYRIAFPVVGGSIVDNVFKAPIYLLGHKTPALFWWLSPLWLFGAFVVIMIIWTKSAVGFIEVLQGAVESGKKAKKKWKQG